MPKLKAFLQMVALSLCSTTSQAQETPPAPEVPSTRVQEIAPRGEEAPPDSNITPVFKRSVIGRNLSAHAPLPAAGSPIPVFVDDVRILADLVSEDNDLAPAAENLAVRGAFLRYWVPSTAIVSAAMLLMGALTRVDAGEWTRTSAGLVAGGGGLLLTAFVVTVSVYPTRSERLTVINAWNHNHPDRPIFP